MEPEDDTPMRQLIGKLVSEVLVGQVPDPVWPGREDDRIFFKTESGWFAWEAVGDCCSETWFADIYGIVSLLGETVLGVKELSLPAPSDGRSRKDVDKAYGVTLSTGKGKATIVYRNSSNGSYGGWIKFLGAVVPPEGGRYARITGDWSA